MNMMFSLQNENPYLGFTIFFALSVVIATLICITVPAVLWISHKRQYAHYNNEDHMRELEIAKDDAKAERRDEQEDTSNAGSDSSRSGSGNNGERQQSPGENTETLPQHNSGRSAISSSTIAVASTPYHAHRRSRRRRRRARQNSSIRQQLFEQRQRYYYAYSSFWTRQLRPDQAMRQLLIFWYFAAFILLLGLSLTTAYLKTRADEVAMQQELSDYYGPMQVQNATIAQKESLERYRWYFYRIFEAGANQRAVAENKVLDCWFHGCCRDYSAFQEEAK